MNSPAKSQKSPYWPNKFGQIGSIGAIRVNTVQDFYLVGGPFKLSVSMFVLCLAVVFGFCISGLQKHDDFDLIQSYTLDGSTATPLEVNRSEIPDSALAMLPPPPPGMDPYHPFPRPPMPFPNGPSFPGMEDHAPHTPPDADEAEEDSYGPNAPVGPWVHSQIHPPMKMPPGYGPPVKLSNTREDLPNPHIFI